jgi:uncharacterized protein (DUF983 family)
VDLRTFRRLGRKNIHHASRAISARPLSFAVQFGHVLEMQKEDSPMTHAETHHAETHDTERPTGQAVRRGLQCRCPRCGKGHLFARYLKVVDTCPECGEELFHHRADDGPAYLTILLVGHIVGFVIHFMWVQFRPEPLTMAITLSVLAVTLSLALLPRMKGMVVGIQWARRMHGFGGPEQE